MSSDQITIYTDGGCKHNPGPMGIGVVMEYKGRTKLYSENLGQGTNNIAELTAIFRALQLMKTKTIPVIIHTDSKYAIGVLTGMYKAKKNQELIAQIRAFMQEFSSIRFKKVKGHAGIPGNEMVDELATRAMNGDVVNETRID